MASRKCTASGYCVKDVQEALDHALATGDVERSCCLAVELACTPQEARNVVAHLVDAYAQWYASCNLWTARRLAELACEMDGAPAVMARFPESAAMRRALAEAVVLVVASSAARSADRWSRYAGCARATSGAEACSGTANLPAPLATYVAALQSALRRGDAKGALATTLDTMAHEGATTPDVPPHAAVGAVSARSRDVAWHLWAELLGGRDGVACEFATASLALYSVAYAKRHRPRRLGLLMSAVLGSATPSKVHSTQPAAALAGMILRARASIDDVFAEVTGQELRNDDGGCGDGHDAPSRDEQHVRPYKPAAFNLLDCIGTTYDDALRCELADERRLPAGTAPPAAVKRLTIATTPSQQHHITSSGCRRHTTL
jgi:hypothetical protein